MGVDAVGHAANDGVFVGLLGSSGSNSQILTRHVGAMGLFKGPQ